MKICHFRSVISSSILSLIFFSHKINQIKAGHNNKYDITNIQVLFRFHLPFLTKIFSQLYLITLSTFGVAPQKGHFACHELSCFALIIFPSMQQNMGKNATSTPRSRKESGICGWRFLASDSSLAISILALGSSFTYHVWIGRTLIFELHC